MLHNTNELSEQRYCDVTNILAKCLNVLLSAELKNGSNDFDVIVCVQKWFMLTIGPGRRL